MNQLLASKAIWKTESESTLLPRTNWLMFLPDNTFKAYWTIITITATIYSIIVSPYQIAFIDTYVLELYALEFFIDGIFFLYIIFTCCTAYYDEESNLIK